MVWGKGWLGKAWDWVVSGDVDDVAENEALTRVEVVAGTEAVTTRL